MKANELELRIVSIIDKIRPFLVNDGGNIEFIRIQDGIVFVSLSGACENCSLIDTTLKDVIEEMITSEIPEVKEVRNINS